MRRASPTSGQFPLLPLLLVVVGALTIVTGVALPIRLLAVGPATIVTGGVPFTRPAVAAGIALCIAGTAALAFGTLLLSFDARLS